MKTKALTLDKVRIKGLRALSRELGPSNYIRFLQQFEHGSGDYTKERVSALEKWSVAEIGKEIKSRHK